ncbi:hypothetical protein [Marinilabilia rubra]|uniref:Uncharacterized protein n=1 Tax=Marinilabilia rubra TaxID=2162893 RepID=A0A2U2BBJ6_9BACT|nr:hypothetical protein [Marinilabilia rubra]PWE00436.1 hypothetical protein DDZ16_05770 [Marinilabilia rubra]
MQNRNQTISIKRFGKYAISRLEMNYKNLLITAATASLIAFFVLSVLIIYNQGNWHGGHWEIFLVVSFLIGGVQYIGQAFPMLRKKEKMLLFYLAPASTFEKFIYELFERMGLLILFFPVLLFGTGMLTIEVTNLIRNYLGLHSELEPLSINYSFEIFSPGALSQIMSGIILILSLIFAGTCMFRKYPGIKIAFILGAYIVLSSVYAEYIAAEHSWYSVYIQNMELNTRRLVYSATMLIVALIALLYGYFRIKEKEVK